MTSDHMDSRVLAVLRKEQVPLTVTELGRRKLGLPHGHLRRILRRLEQRGVAVVDDQGHWRAT